MPLMTSGVYIGSDDRGYEAETSYYLNFQIISALASLAKIDSFNDSYGWENPCQYYHYYTDHLLFSIGQITNRFQVNNRDSEKEKERKTLNRGNYQFSEDRFPLLSDKKARNVVEHIDEYNLNIIESNRGVGGFNLIDASTESTRVQTLRTNRHTHPYTLDLLSHELFIRRNDENLTISYSLQRFTEAVEFAVLYEGSINSSRIYEYTSTLITRLKHLSESEQGDFFDKTSFSSIDDYIRDIIGVSQLLNIDISNLDDTATEVVTKVFSKMLFDYLRALSPRNSMPINLILEEAHRFVRSDMDYGVLGYNIFERIAKEGRKFGLLMGISSQRPSELSKTVVSQCNNFIIHKIQNPDDIQYISRMVPYMNQGMVDRITYLRRGYALVFGTAINLPTLTAFEKASPSPNSGNSNIVEKWYVD